MSPTVTVSSKRDTWALIGAHVKGAKPSQWPVEFPQQYPRPVTLAGERTV